MALAVRVAVKTVDSCLLSTSQLILRESLSRDRVKDVASLTGKALQIVSHVNMGK